MLCIFTLNNKNIGVQTSKEGQVKQNEACLALKVVNSAQVWIPQFIELIIITEKKLSNYKSIIEYKWCNVIKLTTKITSFIVH